MRALDRTYNTEPGRRLVGPWARSPAIGAGRGGRRADEVRQQRALIEGAVRQILDLRRAPAAVGGAGQRAGAVMVGVDDETGSP